MLTVQDKFFALLETQATARGLEVVVAKSFSNCGTLHLQASDSFDTALSLPFDFQPARASFGWQTHRDGHDVFPTRPNPRFAGFSPPELGDAISAILDYALLQRTPKEGAS